MNATLNIQISVASRQAIREMKQVTAAVREVDAAANRAGGGGFMSRASGALRKFGSNIKSTMKDLTNLGKNMQWVGRQLTMNFTLPIAAAGYFATKWALDNERAMTQVRKVYGDLSYTSQQVKEETDALAKSFEMLSNRFGVNQREVIDMAAEWAAAGSAGIGLAKNVRNTLEAAILGDFELIEATEALIATMAAYRLSSEEMTQQLSLMNVIENETAIRMRDLIDVVQRAGGAARTAGVDIRHLSAMAAQLVPATGGAAQAGNALRTTISRIMSPTGAAAKELNRMGLEVETLGWTSLNFVERMERMSKGWKELTASEQAYITSTIASRWQVNRFDVLMQGFIQTNSMYRKSLAVTADETQALKTYQQELAVVLDSNPKKFEIMGNVIRNELASAMVAALPAILGIIQGIASLARWFGNLDPTIQKVVLSGLLFVAVLGPLITYMGATLTLLGQLGTGAMYAGKGFMFFTRNIGGASIRLGRFVGGGLARVLDVAARGLFSFAGIAEKAVAKGVPRIVGAASKGIAAVGRVALVASSQMVAGVARIMTFLSPVVSAVLGRVATVAVATSAMVRNVVVGIFSSLIGTVAGWGRLFTAIHAKVAMGSTGVWSGFLLFWNSLWLTARTIFASALGWMLTYSRRTGEMIALAWARTGALLSSVWHTIVVAWAVAGQVMLNLWGSVQRSVVAITVAAQKLVVGAWALAQAAIRTIAAGGLAFHTFIQSAMAAASAAAAASTAGAWGSAFVFIRTALYRLFLAPVIAAVKFLLGVLATAIAGIAGMLGLPIWATVAIIAAAVGLIVVLFDEGLRGKAIDAIQALVDGLASLPRIVADVFRSVVKVVASAMRAVIEWLSYLNPFARHSPSLVDNVRAGVATILDEYSRLRSIPSVIRSAARAHREFLNATSSASIGFKNRDRTEKRNEVVAAVPSAAPATDAMIGQIVALENELPKLAREIEAQMAVVSRWEAKLAPVTKRLREQEAVLADLEYQFNKIKDTIDAAEDAISDLSNMPIEGMRAFEDAIFDNEMAQKKLRLEILRLEEAGQSVDDLNAKYADLNGMIELLRGERESLRMAGAGSDILSVFDQEIEAMKQQRDALEGQGSQISDINKQLEDLQRQAEILDLEKAITFDPQIKQIDELVNGMEEMPFDEIVRQIKVHKSTIDRLRPSYDALAAQVEAQRAVVESTRYEHEKISATLDVQRDKLDGLKQAYADIESQIRDMESALNGFAQAASSAAAAAGGAAGGAGRPEFGDYDIPGGDSILGPEGDLFDIEQFNKDLEAELDSILGDMDIFGPIKDAWNRAWGWIKGTWDNTVGWVQRNLSFEGLGNVFQSIADGFWRLGSVIRDVWDNWIWPVFDSIWKFVEPVLGPVFRTLGTIVGEVFSFIGGVISGAWNGVIWPVFEAMWGFINGYILPILDMFAAVAQIAFGLAFKAIQLFWTGASGIFNDVWSFVRDKLGPIFRWLYDNVIRPVWSKISSAITGFWSLIRPILQTVITFVRDNVGGAFTRLKDIISGAMGGIRSVVSSVWDRISGIFEAGINFFVSIFNGLAGVIESVGRAVGINVDIRRMSTVNFSGARAAATAGAAQTARHRGGYQGGGMAAGGMLTPWGPAPFTQVGSGFVTNQARAIVGEGSHHPEYVIPTDPKYRRRALMLFQALGGKLGDAAGEVPAMGIGGIIGTITDPLRSVAGGTIDVFKNAFDETIGKGIMLVREVRNIVSGLRGQLSNLDAVGFLKDVAGGLIDKGWDWMWGLIKDMGRGLWDTAKSVGGGVLSMPGKALDWFGLAAGGQIPANPIDLATGGIIRRRTGGTLLRVGEGRHDEKVQVLPLNRSEEQGGNVYNFYGDLEFPNVKDGDDAEQFIKNLKKLAG